MLPPQYRLRKTKDFERIFKQGSFVYDTLIAFKLVKNNLEVTRFGFIVGIKISKKAVVRNKIKRWLRAAVSEYIKDIAPGFDVAVLVKPSIVNSNFEVIKSAIVRLLAKTRLINKTSQKL